MRLEDHTPKVLAAVGDAGGSRAHETSPAPSRSGLRSWGFTIAISTAVLVAMYGLAYWNEAHGGAGRANSAASIEKTVN
jgi:hypothetical protein